MGYAAYENEETKRWEGYGISAPCDWPTCTETINRGESYKCQDHGTFKLFLNGAEISYDRFDDEPDAEEEWIEAEGCGWCLCNEHREKRHIYIHDSITAGKPDTKAWVERLLTDESWQEWRDTYPEKVEALEAARAAHV